MWAKYSERVFLAEIMIIETTNLRAYEYEL